jgi:very-short-patch-repair endonuclease
MRPERDVVVGQVRRRGWRRVGFGLYRRGGHDDPVGLGDFEADLQAWQQVLPDSGCITHLTAAALYGMWLPPLPPRLPIFVSMAKSQTRPKRPELLVMRHTRPIATLRRDGLLLATPEETILACARDLSLLDLVVLGDSALQLGLTSTADLFASASRRRWGAAAMTRAVGWMDRRAESPWESLLRVFHRVCGVRVEPQHNVYHGGRFVARGDLWLTGTRMLHEYDGAVHRDRRTHVQDLERDRRLVAAGWNRRGYTSRDLLHRPEVILADAEATLGRRHRVDRLDPWLGMVAESLFSADGQARLRRRLDRGARASGRSRPGHAG